MILPVLQPLWFLFSVAQAFEADFPKIPWEHRQFAKKNSITCFGVLGKPKKPFFASQEQWFLLLFFFLMFRLSIQIQILQNHFNSYPRYSLTNHVFHSFSTDPTPNASTKHLIFCITVKQRV